MRSIGEVGMCLALACFLAPGQGCNDALGADVALRWTKTLELGRRPINFRQSVALELPSPRAPLRFLDLRSTCGCVAAQCCAATQELEPGTDVKAGTHLELKLVIHPKASARHRRDLQETVQLTGTMDGKPWSCTVQVGYRLDPDASLLGRERTVSLATERPDRPTVAEIVMTEEVRGQVTPDAGSPWLKVVALQGKCVIISAGPVPKVGVFTGKLLIPWPGGGHELVPVQFRAYAPERLEQARVMVRLGSGAKNATPLRLKGIAWSKVECRWRLQWAGDKAAQVSGQGRRGRRSGRAPVPCSDLPWKDASICCAPRRAISSRLEIGSVPSSRSPRAAIL